MARLKSKRELFFKPKYRDFSPTPDSTGLINLHHEEIEAIYLMDFKGMYQEEAAASMGVSRPTFSRIVKNARVKMATALILGKKLHVEDDKESVVVAFMCDDFENFGELGNRKKYIITVEIQDAKIKKMEYAKNPLFNSNAKPAMVIPDALLSKKVNYFLTDNIGEGFKNSLYANGVFTILKNRVDKETLTSIFL